MFTRVVECTCKPGKARDLCRTIQDKVLPTIRKQQGFKDEIVLISQSDSDLVLGISFWNSREDAERYHREQYPKVVETIRNLCESDPEVRTYDVGLSTTHQITAKAA